MSIYSIHGHLLELTVARCSRLKNTEWISRQDPCVCLEYSNTNHRTRTCTDGGKNPIFQEKFGLTLIEGLREMNVVVWNSKTLTSDDFIGTGKNAGEVRLIMHYANAFHHNDPDQYAAPAAYSSYQPHSTPFPSPPPPAAGSYPHMHYAASYPLTPYPPPSPHHSIFSTYPPLPDEKLQAQRDLPKTTGSLYPSRTSKCEINEDKYPFCI